MENHGIKKGLFGYKQQDVCRYVSELNEKNSIKLIKMDEKYTELLQIHKQKIDILETQNQSFNVMNEMLENELKELREKAAYWEQECKLLKEQHISESEHEELGKMNRAVEDKVTDYRKYQFSWEILGDIAGGRPNMGNQVSVEIYRLMQFTFRDIIELQLGTEKADEIFYQSGKLAGKAFYDNIITPEEDLSAYIGQLQRVLKERGIGILRVEKVDMDLGEIILTVSEDLDCSGLPELDYEICTYDEGFISALLETYTGLPFSVKETDCWCTGDRSCRFQAILMD